MSVLQQAQGLLQELRSTMDIKSPSFDKCNNLLSRLKVLSLQFPSNLSQDSPTLDQEQSIYREVLERSCAIALKTQNYPQFSRTFLQLEPLYKNQPPSDQYTLFFACFLLTLLAENNLSQFHTQLETISYQFRQHPLVKYAIRLERCLMEGAYAALTQQEELPAPEFKPLLELILDTTRDDIADCVYRSFTTLSVKELSQLLSLSERDTLEFVRLRSWTVKDNNVIFADEQLGGSKFPVIEVLQQSNKFVDMVSTLE
ncbi:hypothetical protein P9112_008621 [Eukaryota sp. TZLM1-RC]